MTGISLRRVARSFGSVRAVDGVSLEIGDGEFFTLLGPSGCGKTTLLRMIAGFAEVERGEIRFGERRIDSLPPHKRNTGMVFQNYAIFPNLTVADNVAYGLKARGVAKDAAAARVAEALRLVQLGGYEARWPHELSGGQLQRVAIARCLVIEPEVLLLDEPLSNLDARLRVEMRGEIRQLQQKLGITAVYVTHDQEEALAISDRVAVMRAGRVEQVAGPAEIYRRPKTPFVAAFVGTTNLFSGRVVRDGAFLEVDVGRTRFLTPSPPAAGAASPSLSPGGRGITFSLRPEALRVVPPGALPPDGWARVEAKLSRVEFLGAMTRAELLLGGGEVLRLATTELPPGLGETVTLAYDPAQVTVFEAA